MKLSAYQRAHAVVYDYENGKPYFGHGEGTVSKNGDYFYATFEVAGGVFQSGAQPSAMEAMRKAIASSGYTPLTFDEASNAD